jgi:hypothetical protein
MVYVAKSRVGGVTIPSDPPSSLSGAMDHTPAVRVANDELSTVREAMRELNRIVDALERGELDKVVLTQRNRMRAVVVSLERFSELERRAAA